MDNHWWTFAQFFAVVMGMISLVLGGMVLVAHQLCVWGIWMPSYWDRCI